MINIDLTDKPYPILLIASFVISFSLAVIWLVKKRRLRKDEKPESVSFNPFTTPQILGVFGIILFLCPIYLMVAFNLIKGLLFFVLVILRLVNLPEQGVSVVISILVGCLYSGSLIGVYLLGAYAWPKRIKIEA